RNDRRNRNCTNHAGACRKSVRARRAVGRRLRSPHPRRRTHRRSPGGWTNAKSRSRSGDETSYGVKAVALDFGWRSGLPLRSRRSTLTALAAEELHPTPIQFSRNCTDTLQEPVPVLSSSGSDECTDGMLNILPSLGPVDHRNSSPKSRPESRVLSLPEMKSRL